ncbi:hypothetical protein CEXT_445201 [Caerostris extrusa]|uniref:Uncharacterized protein n=1 Tax=Caerostris extrusa TaxID=172846 RepID=A0AAV4XH79_CAEEX|nr:hypothetical protein CEXT_445201 [Caerostris extrusa]
MSKQVNYVSESFFISLSFQTLKFQNGEENVLLFFPQVKLSNDCNIATPTHSLASQCLGFADAHGQTVCCLFVHLQKCVSGIAL